MAFEYITMTGQGLPSAKELNELALSGWRLVTVVPIDNAPTVEQRCFAIYLEREKL